MEDFVVLNNGVRMPRVGLGVYAIPVNQTKDAVLTALSLGYRHRIANKTKPAGVL